MKLLIVSHSCVTPVNQQLFADLARMSGWSLKIVLPATWNDAYGNRQTATRWPSYEGELEPISVFRSGNIPLHLYRTLFIRLLRTDRPDAIFVHNEPYAAATAQIYLANRVALRRPIGFYSAQNISKRYPLPFRWCEAMVYRQSSFAFPCSSAVGQVLREKGYRGQMHEVPYSLDAKIHRPISGAKEALTTQLGMDPRIPLIGYVGRFTPEKGLATLAAALGRVKDQPWALVTVGSGPFRDQFDRLAAEAGIADRIRHLGFLPHNASAHGLSAFDVLVVPSETQLNWREQFGRVVTESLACGTPVLASDSGELPNLIRRTGGGLTFPERDAQSLSDQLMRLLRDAALRSDLVRQGQRVVAREFTTEVVARRVISAIERSIYEPGNNAS
jgi:glycosyltransferase involved in cell wall biosynthesis